MKSGFDFKTGALYVVFKPVRPTLPMMLLGNVDFSKLLMFVAPPPAVSKYQNFLLSGEWLMIFCIFRKQ